MTMRIILALLNYILKCDQYGKCYIMLFKVFYNDEMGYFLPFKWSGDGMNKDKQDGIISRPEWMQETVE